MPWSRHRRHVRFRIERVRSRAPSPVPHKYCGNRANLLSRTIPLKAAESRSASGGALRNQAFHRRTARCLPHRGFAPRPPISHGFTTGVPPPGTVTSIADRPPGMPCALRSDFTASKKSLTCPQGNLAEVCCANSPAGQASAKDSRDADPDPSASPHASLHSQRRNSANRLARAHRCTGVARSPYVPPQALHLGHEDPCRFPGKPAANRPSLPHAILSKSVSHHACHTSISRRASWTQSGPRRFNEDSQRFAAVGRRRRHR